MTLRTERPHAGMLWSGAGIGGLAGIEPVLCIVAASLGRFRASIGLGTRTPTLTRAAGSTRASTVALPATGIADLSMVI
eukprot:7558974-Heterocapsa_arctica.AAC.1